MPLLMCPNCDASMQAVQRASVEFDMCPQCRGVWLDRGELDKVIERSAEDLTPAAAPMQHVPPRQAAPYPQQPYYGKHDDDDYKYKRKKHKSLLGELFDF